MSIRMTRAFANEVLDICINKFEDVGFTKIRKHTVRWSYQSGFHGWVGLNEGLYPTHLRINPNLGIHCEPLERLATLREGIKYSRSGATIAVHMGHIAPDENVITFMTDQPIEPEAQRLVDLYVTYAIPFYEKHQSYESLLPYWLDNLKFLGGYPERVATAYFLMGDARKAKEFTEIFLKKEKEYFTPFAIPFLTFLDENMS